MAPKNKNNNERPVSRASAPNLRRASQKHDAVPVRVEFGGDSSTGITALRTPEPLPPSPAAPDAAWLEQSSTNPAALAPDLSALAGGMDSESLPAWALAPKPAPVMEPRLAEAPAPRRSQGGGFLLVFLLAATCLAVGMVMGALLQSRLGPDKGAAATATECPEPRAPVER